MNKLVARGVRQMISFRNYSSSHSPSLANLFRTKSSSSTDNWNWTKTGLYVLGLAGFATAQTYVSHNKMSYMQPATQICSSSTLETPVAGSSSCSGNSTRTLASYPAADGFFMVLAINDKLTIYFRIMIYYLGYYLYPYMI